MGCGPSRRCGSIEKVRNISNIQHEPATGGAAKTRTGLRVEIPPFKRSPWDELDTDEFNTCLIMMDPECTPRRLRRATRGRPRSSSCGADVFVSQSPKSPKDQCYTPNKGVKAGASFLEAKHGSKTPPISDETIKLWEGLFQNQATTVSSLDGTELYTPEPVRHVICVCNMNTNEKRILAGLPDQKGTTHLLPHYSSVSLDILIGVNVWKASPMAQQSKLASIIHTPLRSPQSHHRSYMCSSKPRSTFRQPNCTRSVRSPSSMEKSRLWASATYRKGLCKHCRRSELA